MKKNFYLFGLLLALSFVVSCTNNIIDEASIPAKQESELSSTLENMINVSDRDNLEYLIENDLTPSTRAIASFYIPAEFVSLMDPVKATDPRLDTLSQEERDTILLNHLTYYEAFGYEDLIPNEGLAKLINTEGEFMVCDTVYKITDSGTLYANVNDVANLRKVAINLAPASTLFANGESKVYLGNSVSIINTFVDLDFYIPDTLTALKPDGGPDPRPTLPPVVDWPGLPGSGSEGTSGTDLSDIPFDQFPQYSATSHTFLGKLIESIIGERHTRHHKFKDKYRVSGSLYCYNYGVYFESGAFVSMDKKRGGFLKKINGWKSVDADELVLHVDSVCLSMEISMPESFLPSMPTAPTVVGSQSINNSSSKHIDILGADLTDGQIRNYFGQGVKYAIQKLSEATNTTIDENTRSFLFSTKETAYLKIYDVTLYKKKSHKLRYVFKSGSNFGFSYNSGSSILENILRNLRDLFKSPRFNLDRGQVRIAGRHGGDWGGMTIVKE